MSATDQKIIFIIGASRSGTTLLSFILRNHSQVFGLNETHFFGEIWDPRSNNERLSEHQLISGAAIILAWQERGVFASRPPRTDLDMAHALVDSLPGDDRNPAGVFVSVVSHLANQAGKSILCEQTPRNIFYADALLHTYPNARVVHVMRDPRAVMASQKKRWQRRHMAADRKTVPLPQSLRVWVNYHPYTAARLWSRASRKAQTLESHPRFTMLRFEDILEDPEQTIRLLCSDLGIDYEPAMLEVGQVNSSHQSSVGGARKGLNKGAIDTWRTTLSSSEASIAERICGDMMAHYRCFPEPEPLPGKSSELT